MTKFSLSFPENGTSDEKKKRSRLYLCDRKHKNEDKKPPASGSEKYYTFSAEDIRFHDVQNHVRSTKDLRLYRRESYRDQYQCLGKFLDLVCVSSLFFTLYYVKSSPSWNHWSLKSGNIPLSNIVSQQIFYNYIMEVRKFYKTTKTSRIFCD